MHELSIALNILDIASKEAERNGGGVVQAVHIRLGPLSGVVKDGFGLWLNHHIETGERIANQVCAIAKI